MVLRALRGNVERCLATRVHAEGENARGVRETHVEQALHRGGVGVSLPRQQVDDRVALQVVHCVNANKTNARIFKLRFFLSDCSPYKITKFVISF